MTSQSIAREANDSAPACPMLSSCQAQERMTHDNSQLRYSRSAYGTCGPLRCLSIPTGGTRRCSRGKLRDKAPSPSQDLPGRTPRWICIRGTDGVENDTMDIRPITQADALVTTPTGLEASRSQPSCSRTFHNLLLQVNGTVVVTVKKS